MPTLTEGAALRPEDFAVFEIDDFEGRMQALRGILRPRLLAIGQRLSGPLSAAYGRTLHLHVAAHQRRHVNPPPETWAAWGPAARGYKAYAHLALGVSADGGWLRLVVKDEAAEARRRWVERLDRGDLGVSARGLPRGAVLIWEGGRALARSATAADLAQAAARLRRRQGAQCALGVDVAKSDPALGDAERLASLALAVFTALRPLYETLNGLSG
jgi:uncharacterized protein YktB (UPF0637 family)